MSPLQENSAQRGKRYTMANTTYNFEKIHNNFTNMTVNEIMQEYATVDKRHRELVTDIESDLGELEQIDLARDFLGHYLALSYCVEHGLVL